MSAAPWIAALPMYDFNPLAPAHDALWSALARHLERAGVPGVPDHLTRDLDHESTWRHHHLLLGQACEYPLAASSTLKVRLVASPRYTAQGCTDARYRSAIVVRTNDPAKQLADLKGRRCVINDPTSNSGMNLLRAALAPLAGNQPFFDDVQVSGSHRASIAAVVGGRADVAAIDCVTLALVLRSEPASGDALRVLDWTPASPSLPFITAANTSDATLDKLRAGLLALTHDPVMPVLRDQLLLDGFDLAPDPGLATVRQLERTAIRLGYATLR
jgi:ABC-type phosphate/phosphonate transport system substrate-binding protein